MTLNPAVAASGCLLPAALLLVLSTVMFTLGAYRRTRQAWPRPGRIWLTFALCGVGVSCGLIVVSIDLLLSSYGTSPVLSAASPLTNDLLYAGGGLTLLSAAALVVWVRVFYTPAAREYGDDALR